MSKAFEETRNIAIMRDKIEIAENLLKMNLGTLEDIAKATGLSLEKVQELASKKSE